MAFKIYYIMAWRAGKTGLLQSSLTRAVIFSAMTTAVAFGSMWASSYPGMSSMGKLMALALLCTMAAAVLFQPVLMGRPRQVKRASRAQPEFARSRGVGIFQFRFSFPGNIERRESDRQVFPVAARRRCSSFFQTFARIHMRSTQPLSQSYRSFPIRPDGDGLAY